MIAVMGLTSEVNPMDAVGFIPTFLNEDDPRPAREQFNEHYISGWNPFTGFTFDKGDLSLSYPGDPPMRPWAGIMFRDEVILVYPHAWVLIILPGGKYEIARMD